MEIKTIIASIMKKQPITFTYKGIDYNFAFYNLDINNKTAVEYFLSTTKEITRDFSQSEAATTELLMKFYLRYQNSLELCSKISNRIIRRGVRKFDVRTLASSVANKDGQGNFNEYITFSKLDFPQTMLDAKKRYEYLINKMKLEEGSKKERNQIFEKAIYLKEFQNMDFDEKDYIEYLNSFVEKLQEWEKRESAFVKEKSSDEPDQMDQVIDKNSIRELHREFLNFFKDEIEKPYFAKMFYDIEGLFYWFWETIFMSIYVEIVSSLNPVERKAFILAYTRQEYIDYHIPLFEPLLLQFLNQLSGDERSELFYALLYEEPKEGEDSLSKKYDDKFTDFLKFFPIWLDIIRMDENMSDEEKVLIRYSKLVPSWRVTGTRSGEKIGTDFYSLFEPINPSAEDSLTFEETLTDGKRTDEVFNQKHIEYIIEHVLTENEREVLNLLYFDQENEYTQQEIAEKLNINQSAVYQRLKSARKKLKKSYR